MINRCAYGCRVQRLQLSWLETKAGLGLLEQERRQASVVLERVFGDQIVQIGSWGPAGMLLEAARTQASIVIGADSADEVDAVVSLERLGIQTDSVDAVLLPHTLELSADPYAVLREVHRILRPEGRLIVLGFNPLSWWGLRHQVALAGYPKGTLRHISARRLGDWLNLLNMRVDHVRPCYVRPPRNAFARLFQRSRLFANAYLMLATKESIPMTIVRPRLGRRPSLVGSLVNPSSTRNVA